MRILYRIFLGAFCFAMMYGIINSPIPKVENKSELEINFDYLVEMRKAEE